MTHHMDLEEARERARKGPRYLMLGRVAMLVISLVSTVTVARLVSPHDFGLAAMALIVLVFAQTFRDMGVTQAALRKGHITSSELSLIFWLTMTSTSLLTVVVMASSPWVAAFFDEPIVTQLLLLASVGFFISGITLQHRVLLERELRFAAVAATDIIAGALAFATTLSLALIRGDAWAIVAGSVVQAVTAGTLVVVLSRWRPGRPRKDPHMWELVRFGANATVYSTSVLFSNQAASLIIGGTMGAAPLGQYNRAQTLYAMPTSNLVQPFARATMPLLLRLRTDPPQYRLTYMALVRRLCIFLVPLSVFLCFASPPLTRVLLGPGWETAGLALLALSPSLALMGLAFAVNDVLITQNRAGTLRNLGLIEAVIRIGAVAIGAQFGVVETALAFTLGSAFVTLVRVVAAGRVPPVSALDQLRATVPGILTGFGAAVGGLAALLAGVATLHSGTQVLVLGAVTVAGALAAGLCWSQSRIALADLADTIGLAGLARMVRRRR